MRSNLRSNGCIDVENPRVCLTGFTQPETLLKHMVKAGDDTGGLFERMLYAAPDRLKKDMEIEEKADLQNVVDVVKVFQLIDSFHLEPREYTLSTEANNYLNAVSSLGIFVIIN